MPVITATEVKSAKSNSDNKYIDATYTITGPTHANRKVFDKVNFKNLNPHAQQIGGARLNAMLAATGLDSVRDTVEFHDRPLKIKLGIEPANGDYPAKNKVLAVLPPRARPAAAPTAPAAPVASHAPARTPAPAPAPAPWA